jgi:hypothetical protein
VQRSVPKLQAKIAISSALTRIAATRAIESGSRASGTISQSENIVQIVRAAASIHPG